MRTLLIIYISFQLWRTQVNSKPPPKPYGLGDHQQKANASISENVETIRNDSRKFDAFDKYPSWQYRPTGAFQFAVVQRQAKTTATSTTRMYLDNDCDYVNYYCMRGFYTGNICAKTIYHTYDTFASYCELEYVNCMENYDLWAVAHMGRCFNVSSFQTFAYYAYAIWDDEQLEEMYVQPTA